MITLTKEDNGKDIMPIYRIDVGVTNGPRGAIQVHTDMSVVGVGHLALIEDLGITQAQEKEILHKVISNAVSLFLQKALDASDTVSEIQIEDISKEVK